MMSKSVLIMIICVVFSASAEVSQARVELRLDQQNKRVDVFTDNVFFTSYRWDERFMRPVLLPVKTASGAFVTRGFPHETRDGETINHPHQVGSSFSYGSVNGVDFWNASRFRSAEEMKHMGRILHRRISSRKNGKTSAELVTSSDWIGPDGKLHLTETTKYTFRSANGIRSVDRETTLTANKERVVFGDSKEGMFAVHVARELQQEDQFPVKITSSAGVISEAADGRGLSGKYFNSLGLNGDKVWGTRAKWAAVKGTLGNEKVTVAVFDHPSNLNFPSYGMVRGYGLLALNPFGQKAYDPALSAASYVLESGKSVRFRHRLLVSTAGTDRIENAYQEFVK